MGLDSSFVIVFLVIGPNVSVGHALLIDNKKPAAATCRRASGGYVASDTPKKARTQLRFGVAVLDGYMNIYIYIYTYMITCLFIYI